MATILSSSDREIVITRRFNAPRDRLWKALTRSELLRRWWAPKGCSTPFCEVDLQPGGCFRYCMRMPDGRDIWGVGTYREIVAPERLVFTDAFSDEQGNPVPPSYYGMDAGHPAEALITATLDGHQHSTVLTLRHSIPSSVKGRDEIERGWKEMLDRLDEYLREVAPEWTPAFELVVEKAIDAPRRRVFEAWTRPEQLTAWFAPRPYRLIVGTMDFRVGGRFKMAMRGPDGSDFPFTGTYREIVPPWKLVWTGEFSTGPADQMTTVVTLTEDGAKTRVHARQIFHIMTSEIEQAVKGARQGWTTTLDQLARFCAPDAGVEDRIETGIDLEAPVSRVWSALTDYREFGEWFRVELDGPFVPGHVSRGHITYPGYEHLRWESVVMVLEPGRRFSYTWHPYAVDPSVDYSKEPPTLVEFRLAKIAAGTRLAVTESGFSRLPDGRRAEAFRQNAAGWAEQMKNLESYLTSVVVDRS